MVVSFVDWEGNRMSFRKKIFVLLVITSFLFPSVVFAESSLEISVLHSEKCGEATFEIDVIGGEGPYQVQLEYDVLKLCLNKNIWTIVS